MKVVILAGGLGTRISEESHLRPKPLIEIGGRPILWHIMKLYASFGFTDFVICAGYRGYMIKEFFFNYFVHQSDITVDLATNNVEYHQSSAEPWKVTVVDTGEDTLTGGRIRRVRSHLNASEPFFMTYGDGLADIDLLAELDYHKRGGRLATLAGVVPPGRYGALELDGDRVASFVEKPPGDNARINGGFFVLEPAVLDLIEGDQTSFEGEPLRELAERGQLGAYPHDGFWQPMDTLRDKNHLEALWAAGQAPWKRWG